MWLQLLVWIVCLTSFNSQPVSEKKINFLWPLENSEDAERYDILDPLQDVSDLEGSEPVIRPDGTTKSREPDDTLLTGGLPGFEEGFTSLDEHLKETSSSKKVEPHKPTNVGNLHPDEVYYADNDMLIIKGGGFNQPTFEEPSQNIELPNESTFDDSYEPQPPSVHEEYNGNIPTIVEAPDHIRKAHQQHTSQSQMYPLALFVPARYLTTRNQYYYTYSPVQLKLRYYLHLPAFPFYAYNPYSIQPLRRPPSLIDDTRVNFLQPLPQINPDAELFSTDSRPSNHNRHVEKLSPKRRTHHATKPHL